MSTTKIAINGYGRIGRDLHRQLLNVPGVEVVAINSRADNESHAYLLKYDSLYGKCDADIQLDGDDMIVNGTRVHVYQIATLPDLDRAKHGIDIVIEATGNFTSKVEADMHLKAGAKKVIITAPCKDLEIPNIVMGVNENEFDPAQYDVVSNASCTTNCLAPVAAVLEREFGIEKAFVTTIHAFTYTQNLLDNSNPEDFRRARATMESVIPTTTGAMKAISRVIPSLEGKMDGMSMRVPVPTVSNIDLVAQLKRDVSVGDLKAAFERYAEAEMKGILAVSTDPVVSVDFRGDSHSAIVDLPLLQVLPGGFVKVIAWYDNEWGYVARVVDWIKFQIKN